MSKKPRLRWSVLLAVSGCAVLLCAQAVPQQKLDAIYHGAEADYDAGLYAQAAHRLEAVLPYATRSFEVHELLGLVYASMSEDAKATGQLKLAVELKPDSAAGHTNLGAILLQSGKAALAGEQFRKALQLEPTNYDANHDLGELYARSGQVAEAQPLLATAYRMKPDAYGNSYDLAMADFLLGRLDEAREVIQGLAKEKNTGELHNLLAQIDEKGGEFVDAASEYETAAHLDPTEDNLFDWGSEMLLHRTYQPAITIFQTAVERYPDSARLQIGLGLSLYSRDEDNEAVKALLKAAALAPSDPRCYYFLSKAYDSSPNQADEVIQAFRRYAALEPENALAQYYYALSLWKGSRSGGSALDLNQVESLFKKAIALNDRLPEAHLELGDLYANRHMYERSIPEYERALALNPDLSDAHYRLGTDYVHVGQREKAQQEFAIYQKLRAEHLAESDKEQAEVKQFVYAAKSAASGKQ
ncbi:MAG: tetratricopeptide repeat protein [Terracidiphilus sp.]